MPAIATARSMYLTVVPYKKTSDKTQYLTKKRYILQKKQIMTFQTINIDLPFDILLTLNESEKELKKRIKISLALQLYIQQKVTIGKAAQIAELSRFQFETLLSENQVPISSLDLADVMDDIEKLK